MTCDTIYGGGNGSDGSACFHTYLLEKSSEGLEDTTSDNVSDIKDLDLITGFNNNNKMIINLFIKCPLTACRHYKSAVQQYKYYF